MWQPDAGNHWVRDLARDLCWCLGIHVAHHVGNTDLEDIIGELRARDGDVLANYGPTGYARSKIFVGIRAIGALADDRVVIDSNQNGWLIRICVDLIEWKHIVPDIFAVCVKCLKLVG